MAGPRLRAAVILLACAGALGCGAICKVDYPWVFSRAGWQRPERVVEALGIAPGDAVADLGAGDGYFVPYLAEAVGPEGRVFAVEVDPEKLQALHDLVDRQGHDNVVVVEGAPDDPGLPDAGIDLVLLVNVYHHIDDRVRYFRRLRDDLRPGRGRIATIDMHSSGLGALVTPDGHWTDLDVLHREMSEAGYRSVASFDFLPTQSLEVFSPDPAEPGPRASQP